VSVVLVDLVVVRFSFVMLIQSKLLQQMVYLLLSLLNLSLVVVVLVVLRLMVPVLLVVMLWLMMIVVLGMAVLLMMVLGPWPRSSSRWRSPGPGSTRRTRQARS